MKSDVFFSYAAHDAELAEQLCEPLTAAGAKVFLAHRSVEGGSIWADRLLRELDAALCLFFLVTEEACGSAYVQQEIGVAIGLKKPVVPIVARAFEGELPGLVQRYQRIDLSAHTPETRLARLSELGAKVAKRRKLVDTISDSSLLWLVSKVVRLDRNPDWLG